MKTSYADMVIFGAGFYSVSLLINSAKDAILIEKGTRIGNEFSSSLKVCRCIKPPESEFGKMFYEKLTADGYIKDGYVYSVPAAFLIAELLKGKRMMFGTEVSSVRKENGNYIIKIFNSDGYSEIITPVIVDTTSEGIFGDVQADKFLNIMCRSETQIFDVFSGCYIMEFKAEKGEELFDTRKRLFGYLEDNKELNAVYIADEYSYKIADGFYKKEDSYYHIPAAAFEDIITAVDSGGGGFYGI